VVAWSTERWR